MNILILEAVTAGLVPPKTTDALYEEAQSMLLAVLKDFGEMPKLTLSTVRLASLPPLSLNTVRIVSRPNDIRAVFQEAYDRVLIIAPESEGRLHELSRLSDLHKLSRLGSSLEAIHQCSDKRLTAQTLEAFQIPHPRTFCEPTGLPQPEAGYIVKPRDGCGSEGVFRVMSETELKDRWGERSDCIVQERVIGIDASASVFFTKDDGLLLSLNRQHIGWTPSGHAEFLGVETGALEQLRPHVLPLIPKIKRAFPGLWGFVGIDFVAGSEGPVIIEINPRITSAYNGLRRVLGYNPAEHWFSLRRP